MMKNFFVLIFLFTALMSCGNEKDQSQHTKHDHHVGIATHICGPRTDLILLFEKSISGFEMGNAKCGKMVYTSKYTFSRTSTHD